MISRRGILPVAFASRQIAKMFNNSISSLTFAESWRLSKVVNNAASREPTLFNRKEVISVALVKLIDWPSVALPRTITVALKQASLIQGAGMARISSRNKLHDTIGMIVRLQMPVKSVRVQNVQFEGGGGLGRHKLVTILLSIVTAPSNAMTLPNTVASPFRVTLAWAIMVP